jgi:DNA invertase Pin-like site-specific DNA recombinase
MDRPGWQKLQAAIDRGEVERVCCWRLDRLGRTARGLTSLFADLQTHGVGLVSLKDGIDLGTAAGRMLANVLASIAQFETELRAERVLAGQEAAWKAGKTWGGSKKGRRLHVTAEAAEAVKRLHSEGKPIAAIGRAVGLSRPTIYTLIEN